MYIIYIYICNDWVLTSFRALRGWGCGPMHSAWIGQLDLKRRLSGLQHAGVPESRRSGNDMSLEFWCLGEVVFYIFYENIHIEREREKETNFIQLHLCPQGLVIALILWCIYCATSAEIQVPEGARATVITLPSTWSTWHPKKPLVTPLPLREFDTWCAGRQCWRWPKLVLALSLLLDRWAFEVFELRWHSWCFYRWNFVDKHVAANIV